MGKERERTEQWRRLALRLDAHRIQALRLLREVISGDADSTSIQCFLATPSDLATHAHRKGGKYVLLGYGNLQSMYWIDCRTSPLLPHARRSVDMAPLAIYRSEDDGSLWGRPQEEWEDGRFIQL